MIDSMKYEDFLVSLESREQAADEMDQTETAEAIEVMSESDFKELHEAIKANDATKAGLLFIRAYDALKSWHAKGIETDRQATLN